MNTAKSISLLYFLIPIIALILLILFVKWFMEYKYQANYINIEIMRSSGAEKRYWIKQKKFLWYKVLKTLFR